MNILRRVWILVEIPEVTKPGIEMYQFPPLSDKSSLEADSFDLK